MTDKDIDLETAARFVWTEDQVTRHPKKKKQSSGSGTHRKFHGTPGRPGYPTLHPSGKNKVPVQEGSEKTPKGGVLGSNRFTPEEHKEAGQEYLFEAYSMNAWMRDRKVVDGTPHDREDLEDYTAKLRDLIAVQEPSTKEEVFYRGMQDPYSFSRELKRGAYQMRKGDVFHDRGFVSTSRKKEVADKFRTLGGGSETGGFIMRITVPKGTRFLDTDTTIHDSPQWESENILMPGTKFRFRGYVGSAFDQPPILDVEVVPV